MSEDNDVPDGPLLTDRLNMSTWLEDDSVVEYEKESSSSETASCTTNGEIQANGCSSPSLSVSPTATSRSESPDPDLHKPLQVDDIKQLIQKTTAQQEDVYQAQILALETTVSRLQQEIQDLKHSKKEDEDRYNSSLAELKAASAAELDRVSENFRHEKESMVMKYASSEKAVITQRKEKEQIERKLKDATREIDGLSSRLRAMGTDKGRISQNLETKTSEAYAMKRECERLRDEISSRDVKLKWTQNKLNAETDKFKETQRQLERVQLQVISSREELEQMHREYQEILRLHRSTAESEECTGDSTEGESGPRRDMEALRRKQLLIIEENNSLAMKVQSLERERLEQDHKFGKLQSEYNSAQQVIADLQVQIAETESVKLQLQREQERLIASQAEVERLRQANTDLLTDMASCRQKEAELLDFTQSVTNKYVNHQFDVTSLETKLQESSLELEKVHTQFQDVQNQYQLLQSEVGNEKKQCESQVKELEDKLKASEVRKTELEQELADARNDTEVWRRKHNATLAEFMRELKKVRRRLEVYENQSASGDAPGSDATSNGNCSSGRVSPKEAPVLEINQQVLVQRIVKLQRTLARRNEKVDFLEEHVRQLVDSLKKKSHLLQVFMTRQEGGQLTSEGSDHNKREMMRHGGIMASVYTSQPADEGMTLELSLDINRKLQGVLEDTLLKNITLKESIHTLGQEISRLCEENKKLKTGGYEKKVVPSLL